jgi:hypothetical protein
MRARENMPAMVAQIQSTNALAKGKAARWQG